MGDLNEIYHENDHNLNTKNSLQLKTMCTPSGK